MNIRTRRKPMRVVAVAAAAALTASLLAISGPTNVGAAPVVTESTRIAGADRYATANAVAIAKVGVARNASRVVLVSGENFPDGLAASSLAGALGAPMLLTQSASLPISVLATLTTITSGVTAGTAKIVVIVGGTTAVSADVATQLTASGYTVTRISGDDRYATANAVAAATRTNNVAIGTFGASNLRTAFLASGTNFPDALAASAQAYKGKHPIFLTNGTTLTDETKAAMIAAQVQQVIILGGVSAVSAEVATAVAGVTGVISSLRIAGDTRYDTATALATALGAADATFKSKAFLVSGTDFPDALVAAQLAGGATGGGAIIPVTSPLPAAVTTWVTANQSTLANIQAIGGTSAVPAEIVTEVKTGATTAPLSATITAVDGAPSFTVAFSAGVTQASAELATNYRVTSAIGTSKTVSSGTYVAVGWTVTIPVTGGLAAGDTIQLLPNSVVSSVTANLVVSAASVTVAADTSAPTITIVAYPTTVGAVPSDPSAQDRVWVTLSSNTRLVDVALVESRLNLMTFTGTTIGAVPTVFANDFVQQPGAPNTFVGSYTTAVIGGFIAGGTLALAAGTVTSSASTPVGSAATTTIITADTTAPAISSVTFVQASSGVGAVQASRGLVGGFVTVSARATAARDGKVGNAVRVATVATPNFNPACEFSAVTNTVTLSAAVTSSAIAIANACNVVPAFNALFVATPDAATAGTAVASWATVDAALMTGGLDMVILTVTTSKAIDPDLPFAGLTFANVVGSTSTTFGIVVESGLSTSDVQHLAGVVTILVTTNGTFTANLTTVAAIAASVRDRAGNAMAATAVVVTAPAAS